MCIFAFISKMQCVQANIAHQGYLCENLLFLVYEVM